MYYTAPNPCTSKTSRFLDVFERETEDGINIVWHSYGFDVQEPYNFLQYYMMKKKMMLMMLIKIMKLKLSPILVFERLYSHLPGCHMIV